MKLPLHTDNPVKIAEHAFDMFNLNPKGFRTPSSRNCFDVSYVESRAIRAGLTTPPGPNRIRSKRGEKKYTNKLAFLDAYKANPRNTMSNRQRRGSA